MLARAHLTGLFAFALLLGLFEGPAEIACVFALVTLLLTRRLQGMTLGAIELALLVWLISGTVGVLRAEVEVRSETLTRPLLVLAYLLGRGSVAHLDARSLSKMAWFFGAAIAVNGAYGLLQVFGFDPPLETLIIGRQKHGHLVDPENTERLRMATGLFYNRIKLAHLGVVGLSLFAVLVAMPGRVRRYAVLGAVILGSAIFFTYRRAAPLSLLISIALFGLFFAGANRKRWLQGAGGLALLVFVAFVGTETGRARIASAEEALFERFEIYRYGLRLFSEAPIFGVGHGHYSALIGTVTDRLSPLLQTSAHSWWLETLVETGLVGAGALIFAVSAAMLRLTRRLIAASGSTPDGRVLLDRFAWIALTSISILGLAHSVLYHRPVALAFWVLLGVASAPAREIRATDLSSSAGPDTGAGR